MCLKFQEEDDYNLEWPLLKITGVGGLQEASQLRKRDHRKPNGTWICCSLAWFYELTWEL